MQKSMLKSDARADTATKKKDEIFKTLYRDHWMIWAGTVEISSANSAALNIDGQGVRKSSPDPV
jgi:hypothetical protein